MRESSTARWWAACGWLALATGCPFSNTDPADEGPTRCEEDRFLCQEIAEVPAVGGCSQDADLVVTLGYGTEAFAIALSRQEPPTIEGSGGGFQGAGTTHTAFGLRIEGAELDLYDVLGAEIGVFEAHACTTQGEVRSCEGVPWVASRTVLLGDGPPLNVVDGVVEEFGITAPMEREPGSFVVQAVVRDPCGRQGVTHHDFSL